MNNETNKPRFFVSILRSYTTTMKVITLFERQISISIMDLQDDNDKMTRIRRDVGKKHVVNAFYNLYYN